AGGGEVQVPGGQPRTLEAGEGEAQANGLGGGDLRRQGEGVQAPGVVAQPRRGGGGADDRCRRGAGKAAGTGQFARQPQAQVGEIVGLQVPVQSPGLPQAAVYREAVVPHPEAQVVAGDGAVRQGQGAGPGEGQVVQGSAEVANGDGGRQGPVPPAAAARQVRRQQCWPPGQQWRGIQVPGLQGQIPANARQPLNGAPGGGAAIGGVQGQGGNGKVFRGAVGGKGEGGGQGLALQLFPRGGGRQVAVGDGCRSFQAGFPGQLVGRQGARRTEGAGAGQRQVVARQVEVVPAVDQVEHQQPRVEIHPPGGVVQPHPALAGDGEGALQPMAEFQPGDGPAKVQAAPPGTLFRGGLPTALQRQGVGKAGADPPGEGGAAQGGRHLQVVDMEVAGAAHPAEQNPGNHQWLLSVPVN